MNLLVLLHLFVSISGERDTNYYGQFQNPNLNLGQYWSSSYNLLQDLDQFEKLYIKYENCAWSTAKYTSSDFDDDDDNDGNNNKRRLDDNVCGYGGGGDENNWWIGMSECKQSNVAFSLYGKLKNQRYHNENWYDILSGRQLEGACTAYTFINSFFTVDGMHSFVKATQKQVDTSTAVPYCSYYCGEDDDDCGGSGDHRWLEGSHDEGEDTAYVATGCSASSGNFTVDRFLSGTCNGNYYNDTLYQLSDINADLQELNCELIYDADKSMDYASSLLYYSQACSITGQDRDYCPDPHGILNYYEYNFQMAQSNHSYVALEFEEMNMIQSTPVWQLPVVEAFLSGMFFVFGGHLILSGIRRRRGT